MTRTAFPFYAGDISALARSLHNQLADCEQIPGHVEMLNILARAAGSRNFQHFRAQAAARLKLSGPAERTLDVDFVELQRCLRYFDLQGRLTRWPAKFSHQEPCLWVLWSRILPRTKFSERSVNEVLLANHRFEDPALLRRELKERNMVTRTPDGREYRRVERKPPPLALALIRRLRESM